MAKKMRQNAKRYVKDRLRAGELVAKARIKPCPWWMPALVWHVLIHLVLRDANARGTASIADIRAPGRTMPTIDEARVAIHQEIIAEAREKQEAAHG